jgi:hypothetical protein
MKIRLFDPTGVKPEDYKHRYPELERTPEFSELHTRALLFVWWFSNPTSEFVLDIHDDYERAEKALAKSQFNPGKTERESILRCQFSSELAAAIKKMQGYDPGARFKSYLMIKKIFDNYQRIVDQGPAAFATTEGEGENEITYTDHKRYVDVTAKIAEEIPNLLLKLEEGFGIIDMAGEEKEIEEGASSIREWHQGRHND